MRHGFLYSLSFPNGNDRQVNGIPNQYGWSGGGAWCFLGGGGDAVCPFYREACLFPRGVLVSGDSLGVRERFSTIHMLNGSLRRE